jgi:hypothetical protein
MMPLWQILKHPLTMSSGGKVQFKNTNCKMDHTKRAMKKIDIQYDDNIACDYEQCQKAASLGYVNPQGMAKEQILRE